MMRDLFKQSACASLVKRTSLRTLFEVNVSHDGQRIRLPKVDCECCVTVGGPDLGQSTGAGC
jgi:hypothetical protein